MQVLSLAARLATKLSVAQAHVTLCWFLTEAPSTEVIKNTALGLGRYTQEWFASAPAPKNDGEVHVIQIDGKAVPSDSDGQCTLQAPQIKKPDLTQNTSSHFAGGPVLAAIFDGGPL
jgi:hypothetical protein